MRRTGCASTPRNRPSSPTRSLAMRYTAADRPPGVLGNSPLPGRVVELRQARAQHLVANEARRLVVVVDPVHETVLEIDRMRLAHRDAVRRPHRHVGLQSLRAPARHTHTRARTHARTHVTRSVLHSLCAVVRASLGRGGSSAPAALRWQLPRASLSSLAGARLGRTAIYVLYATAGHPAAGPNIPRAPSRAVVDRMVPCHHRDGSIRVIINTAIQSVAQRKRRFQCN